MLATRGAKNILMVKLGAVGDVSFMLPSVAAIQNLFPQSEITWVVGATSAPLIDGLKGLSRVVKVNEKLFYSDSKIDRLRELVRLRSELQRRYDLIIIGHRSNAYSLAFKLLTSGPVVQLSRTTDTPMELLLRRGVHVKPMTTHESYALKKLVEDGLRAFSEWQKPVLNWQWDYSHIPKTQLNLPKNYVAIHVGGGQNAKTEFRLKQWPKMQELAQTVLEKTDHSVVFVGAPGEASGVGRDERIVDLVGKTSLRDLVDVLRRAQGFVGADSGPLHIADSLGVPCVGIFGPTSPISWGLMGALSRAVFLSPECAPCYKDDGNFPECSYNHKCMTGISLDRVFRELLDVMCEVQRLDSPKGDFS